MSIHLEGATVRLDAQGWRELVEGSAPQCSQVEAIAGMDRALAAVRAPLARLALDLVAPGGRFTHLAWLAQDAVALLRDGAAGGRRLLALPPDRLPVALARLTGLGPRPAIDPEAAGAPVVVSPEEAEALWAEDPGSVRAALERLGADRAWRLTVTPASGLVLDSLAALAVDGPAGIRLLGTAATDAPAGAGMQTGDGPGPGTVELRPVTPTALWTLFAGVLPALSGRA